MTAPGREIRFDVWDFEVSCRDRRSVISYVSFLFIPKTVLWTVGLAWPDELCSTWFSLFEAFTYN